MLIIPSVLVQTGSMRAQMKGIGGGFQIIYAFLWIYWEIFYSQQNYTFPGVKKKKRQNYTFERASRPTIKSAKSVHIWQLSLNSIEWLAKSRVLKRFEIFWKIGMFVKFYEKIHKKIIIFNIKSIRVDLGVSDFNGQIFSCTKVIFITILVTVCTSHNPQSTDSNRELTAPNHGGFICTDVPTAQPIEKPTYRVRT